MLSRLGQLKINASLVNASLVNAIITDGVLYLCLEIFTDYICVLEQFEEKFFPTACREDSNISNNFHFKVLY